MKKTICWLAVLLLVNNITFAENEVIRILNWSEFIALDDDLDENLPIAERSPVLKKFMEVYNCKVEYYEYEETAQMIKMISNTPGFYDIVVASHTDVKDLINGQQLESISTSKLTNYKHLIKKYNSEKFGKLENFYIPYLVGTTGLLYRKDLCQDKMTSWGHIFQPKAQ